MQKNDTVADISRREFLKLSACSTLVALSHSGALAGPNQFGNFAIIGYDNFTDKLLRILIGQDNRCVGVVDNKAPVRPPEHVACFEHVSELLAKPRPHSVIISGLHHHRYQDALRCIKSSASVFVVPPTSGSLSAWLDLEKHTQGIGPYILSLSSANVMPEMTSLSTFIARGGLGSIDRIEIRVYTPIALPSDHLSHPQANDSATGLFETSIQHVFSSLPQQHLAFARAMGIGEGTPGHHPQLIEWTGRLLLDKIPLDFNVQSNGQVKVPSAEITYFGSHGTAHLDCRRGWTALSQTSHSKPVACKICPDSDFETHWAHSVVKYLHTESQGLWGTTAKAQQRLRDGTSASLCVMAALRSGRMFRNRNETSLSDFANMESSSYLSS